MAGTKAFPLTPERRMRTGHRGDFPTCGVRHICSLPDVQRLQRPMSCEVARSIAHTRYAVPDHTVELALFLSGNDCPSRRIPLSVRWVRFAMLLTCYLPHGQPHTPFGE
jgi:hypothetical protein